MTLFEKFLLASDDFLSHPEAIDITRPKIFAAACLIAILLGVFVGLGYWLVFNSQDCIAATGDCLVNPYAEHKLVIIAITVIAGIVGGAAIPFVRWYKSYQGE